MITEAIITGLLAALDALLSLLPVVALPVVAAAGFASTFAGYVTQLHGVVPVGDVVVMLLAAIAVTFALAVFDVAAWVYHQFWGSS